MARLFEFNRYFFLILSVTGFAFSIPSFAQKKPVTHFQFNLFEYTQERFKQPYSIPADCPFWMDDPRHPFYDYYRSINDERLSDVPMEFRHIHIPQQLDNIYRSAKQGHVYSSLGVRENWVRVYETRTSPGYDVATDLVIDEENNVYVTGYSTNHPNGFDFYTIKYDAYGNRIWGEYFDGEAHGDDTYPQIGIDGSGNLYVGGNSEGMGGSDIVIIQYNGEGEKQWVVRYDGVHFYDMSVDRPGNVLVTGSKDGDYVTVKYDSQGTRKWVARYDIPENGYEVPYAIDVDIHGNVYVTGETRSSDANKDIATVKYDAEGAFQWEARFTSPTDYSHDWGYGIDVDDSGNVYVIGTCLYEKGQIYGHDRDYVTIKYNAHGEELWIAFYDTGAEGYGDYVRDLALDEDGNVYVTGESQSVDNNQGFEFATVKYNASGEQLWVARHGDGKPAYSGATDIAIDDSGDIIVTGFGEFENSKRDYVTIKYDTEGEQIWMARYDGLAHGYDKPNAAVVSSSGELFITGKSDGTGTDNDYATVKLNAQGDQEWAVRFNGKNREQGSAKDLVIDDEGNIYVTGVSNGGIATVKYDPNGNLVWSDHYDENTYPMYAYPQININERGNIIVVAGYAVVIEYDTQGNRIGINEYESGIISFNQSGNVFLTTRSDFITTKFDSNGNQEWVAGYTSNDYGHYSASRMAVDSRGNVYIFGRGSGYEEGQRSDFITVKYDPKGRQEWVRYYDTSNDALAYGLVVDGWGNIYILGRTEYRELSVVKYNPDGNRQWDVHYQCAEKCGLYFSGFKGDVLGNVYVLMRRNNGNTSVWDSIILKYNTEGVKQWEACLDVSGLNDMAGDFTVDHSGNVYVTGASMGVGTGFDIVTVKYDSRGVRLWEAMAAGQGNTNDDGNAIAVDASGNVCVAGEFGEGTYWSMYNVIRYSQTGEDSLIAPDLSGYRLIQNQPNPCNNRTLIRYVLPKSSRVTIKVFSVSGRQVIFEDLGERPAGQHPYYVRTDALPSGVYYYQLQADDFVETRKMVVMH